MFRNFHSMDQDQIINISKSKVLEYTWLLGALQDWKWIMYQINLTLFYMGLLQELFSNLK